ncbi:MAG TPA: peptidase [Alphaproteobacteria bacterium]|nr:peptidase [Alphaproteobacteria bacterium]
MKNQKVLYGMNLPRKKSDSSLELYHKLDLKDKLNYRVFAKAYDSFKSHSKIDILTVIDYTKPSSEKRLFVLDMKIHKLVFNTWVAHGTNSGGKFAENFSNVKSSRQTSLGVFITAETYYGKNGYSLKLDGKTPGVNDKARERYIVIHGADYASKPFLDKYGVLGTSWGCPALPVDLAKNVINTIKGGSVIYAHG